MLQRLPEYLKRPIIDTEKTKTVRKKTVREIEREQKIQAEKLESREFYRRNRKSDSKRSLKIAKAGKRRILRANKRAELVENLGKMRARNQASKGNYRDARKTSRKAIEKSNKIIYNRLYNTYNYFNASYRCC